MTAADQLRQAAAAIREHETEPWIHNVAYWLDYAADQWGDTDPRFIGRGAHIDPALDVARAYLEATS